MKSSKFIKLLAALLCVVMAFVSCSGDTANADGANPDAIQPLSSQVPLLDDAAGGEIPAAPVYSSLSELIEYKYKSPDYFKEALKLDGEIYEYGLAGIIMKTSEIGSDNLAKEVFNVYNYLTGECVLTVENTYDYTEAKKLNDVDVYFDGYFGEDNGLVVVVERTTRTLITDEEKEGNFRFDDSLYYKEESSYEFYDMSGKLFDTANRYYDVEVSEPNMLIGGSIVVYVNGDAHFFNDKLECVKSYAENEVPMVYDFERGLYGYVLRQSFFDTKMFIQVYDLNTNAIISEYDVTDADCILPLDDGNIFVQYCTPIFDGGADYDYYNANELKKYNLKNEIINVESGERVEIDFDYVVSAVRTASDLARYAETVSAYAPYDVVYKDTIINIANGRKIEDKMLSDDTYAIFVDNAFNVSYVQSIPYSGDPLPDSAPILAESYKLLSNGATLYDMDDYQTIVYSDGRAVNLPNNAEVYDPFVITENEVYDLNLKLIVRRNDYGYDYNDGDDYVKNVLNYEFTVGDIGIFSSYERYSDGYDDDDNTIYKYEYRYYKVYKSGDSYTVQHMPEMDSLKGERVYDWDSSYVIFKNENDKYVLYNSKLEHVYTSENPIYVKYMNGLYWFTTNSSFEGKDLVFKIN